MNELWYLAGGLPRLPLGAYKAIDAASLEASQINLANPGTYDLIKLYNPGFNPAYGWDFASDLPRWGCFDTGITLPAGARWTIGMRFSDWNGGGAWGATDMAGSDCQFWPNNGANKILGAYSNIQTITPRLVSGVYFLTSSCYRDGKKEGVAFTSNTSVDLATLHIAAVKRTDTGGFYTAGLGKGQAFVIYDYELTDWQIAMVSYEMASLEIGPATGGGRAYWNKVRPKFGPHKIEPPEPHRAAFLSGGPLQNGVEQTGSLADLIRSGGPKRGGQHAP
jgi:hypothetical protein